MTLNFPSEPPSALTSADATHEIAGQLASALSVSDTDIRYLGKNRMDLFVRPWL